MFGKAQATNNNEANIRLFNNCCDNICCESFFNPVITFNGETINLCPENIYCILWPFLWPFILCWCVLPFLYGFCILGGRDCIRDCVELYESNRV